MKLGEEEGVREGDDVLMEVRLAVLVPGALKVSVRVRETEGEAEKLAVWLDVRVLREETEREGEALPAVPRRDSVTLVVSDTVRDGVREPEVECLWALGELDALPTLREAEGSGGEGVTEGDSVPPPPPLPSKIPSAPGEVDGEPVAPLELGEAMEEDESRWLFDCVAETQAAAGGEGVRRGEVLHVPDPPVALLDSLALWDAEAHAVPLGEGRSEAESEGAAEGDRGALRERGPVGEALGLEEREGEALALPEALGEALAEGRRGLGLIENRGEALKEAEEV